MYSHAVVFLHLLSAIVWIGGMIAIRVAVHPALQSIDDGAMKLGKTLEITGRLFVLVVPFIITLIVTGLMMAISSSGHHGSMKIFFIIKESIWTVMTLNFIYMFIQRRAAWRLFEAKKMLEAKEKVKLIPNLLLPINIVLGIVAVWFGVTLRGL